MTADHCSGHGSYNAYCAACVSLRLVAAERVVEAVAVLIAANWNDADGRGRGERDAVVAALTDYRKASEDK